MISSTGNQCKNYWCDISHTFTNAVFKIWRVFYTTPQIQLVAFQVLLTTSCGQGLLGWTGRARWWVSWEERSVFFSSSCFPSTHLCAYVCSVSNMLLHGFEFHFHIFAQASLALSTFLAIAYLSDTFLIHEGSPYAPSCCLEPPVHTFWRLESVRKLVHGAPGNDSTWCWCSCKVSRGTAFGPGCPS